MKFCSDIFHGLFLAASVVHIAAFGVYHSRSILFVVTGPEAYCVVVPRHFSSPRGGLPERRHYYTISAPTVRNDKRASRRQCASCHCFSFFPFSHKTSFNSRRNYITPRFISKIFPTPFPTLFFTAISTSPFNPSSTVSHRPYHKDPWLTLGQPFSRIVARA